MVAEKGLRSAEFVQSLDRGLAVIRAFDAAHPSLTLSDVARSTGLNRAAARRFLHTFVELGYIRNDGRLFSLRPRVLELGYAYLSGLTLPKIAQPHLEDLVAELHESCSVSVLDGGDVVYVARVPTTRIMTVSISVGTRFPAYATSMGRVLMAAQSAQWMEEYLAATQLKPLTENTVTDPEELAGIIDEVRRDGYSLMDQELELGLRSLAVPVHGKRGDVVAAMNVSTHASSSSLEAMRQDLLPRLQASVTRVEADLRGAA